MVWTKIKESLKETLADNIFSLWIEPLQFEQLQGNRLYLSGPDRYFSAYVKQNFSSVIEDKLQENGLQSTQIIFCEKSPERMVVSSAKKSAPRTQMRLPNVPVNNSKFRALHPRYTFDEFLVGDCNILAESACRSMVAEDGLVGPCLYINSGTGLGKSHLTHAVAHQVFTQSPMTRLHYLTAKQFAAEMIRGIQTKTMDEFKRKYQENCDILLVEDVHSLTGKKKTQEELNDILDTLIKSGKRVILTSKSTPGDLVGIDNEFRSRMTSGLVTTMKAPDVKTRYRIVEKKAMQQQLQLDEELVDFLANHIRGDVRKIESALIAVRARARLAGGHVDMDLIKEVVGSVVGVNHILTAQMISELVGGQFNVSVKELQSKSRKRAITTPRQIAMYLARKYTEDSLVDIGKAFNRDHSTVLHSIKVVSNKLVRDTSVNAQLEILSNKVKQL
ncbi:MAG: chromosomal replication initiator protein DnaA [Desulfobulbaceae bacterium]|nr:chromosomal replication initiator protein DnaA [Desulfobulbaceae bacterium]